MKKQWRKKEVIFSSLIIFIVVSNIICWMGYYRAATTYGGNIIMRVLFWLVPPQIANIILSVFLFLKKVGEKRLRENIAFFLLFCNAIFIGLWVYALVVVGGVFR